MKLLLGTRSPRRIDLLRGAQIPFELVDIDTDENFPDDLPPLEVAAYLAEKKSYAYTQLLVNQLLLTADTTVVLDGKIINKPLDPEDAVRMLEHLSGQMHKVCTGVSLRSEKGIQTITDITNVYFNKLTRSQVAYYVKNFSPLDKAGAYGIQEWIGYIGVSKIEGDFFNVMGLPVNRVYQMLAGQITDPF